MPEEIIIVHVITCGREHKIGRWIQYMSSLTACKIMSFEDNTSSCSTSAMEKNGTSETSVASVSASSAVSVAFRGSSDVSLVSSGNRIGSDRVWISCF